jgi:hypothetical protein
VSTRLLTDQLWPSIQKLARTSRRREVVAAYLGTGADRLLKLKAGDSLVVDMSMATVKGGQTNPSEVVKYLRHGVQVFNCTNLHAKVYVYDNAAIIGSANVSRHSAETLVEAGLLCTDRQAVSQARGFVRSLQVEPISLKYARQCQRLYNPPMRGAGRGKQQQRTVTPTHSRLWLVGVSPVEFSGKEDALCEREQQRAKKKLRNRRQYEVNSIRWTGLRSHFTKQVKQGDLLVQIWSEKKKAYVYPPSRVLRITHYRSFDRTRKPRMFVHAEEERNPKTIILQRFLKAVKPVGLTRIGVCSESEVRSAEAAHTILGLWR